MKDAANTAQPDEQFKTAIIKLMGAVDAVPGGPPAPREISPTAANASNRLYGTSGEMDYLVILATQGGGQKGAVIKSATGDGAADQAATRNPGWKVVYVGPAADAPPSITVAD